MFTENSPQIIDLTTWQPAHRPGFFGSRRAQVEAALDGQCGSNGWTLAWRYGPVFLNYPAAVKLYEDAYVYFLASRPDLQEFLKQFVDFYDNGVTNVECGLDYVHEEIRRTRSNHIQDIALRWARVRLHIPPDPAGRLLEVRGHKSEGAALSPGVVPFHAPWMIPTPEIKPDWAKTGSVEAYWQSAKHVMVKRSLFAK